MRLCDSRVSGVTDVSVYVLHVPWHSEHVTHPCLSDFRFSSFSEPGNSGVHVEDNVTKVRIGPRCGSGSVVFNVLGILLHDVHRWLEDRNA
jgi:hypothetical protein